MLDFPAIPPDMGQASASKLVTRNLRRLVGDHGLAAIASRDDVLKTLGSAVNELQLRVVELETSSERDHATTTDRLRLLRVACDQLERRVYPKTFRERLRWLVLGR